MRKFCSELFSRCCIFAPILLRNALKIIHLISGLTLWQAFGGETNGASGDWNFLFRFSFATRFQSTEELFPMVFRPQWPFACAP